METRRVFLRGVTAALLAISGGARHLFAQLIGSKYKFVMGRGPGPETIINGTRFLYFGGTGYFGFQTHPELIKAAQKAVAEFGMCSATSRNVFGTSPLHLEVENKAREFFGTEDSIYLPSGYLINIAGLQSLAQLQRFDAMFVDDGAHWSITDVMYAVQKPVYTFAHGDPENLGRKLKANLKAGQKPLVVSDGIFPTFGKIAPIPEYLKQVEPYDGCMWLDDCHAIGANASVSAAAAAAVKGMELMMTQPGLRQQLWRNARQLKAGLKAIGFDQDDSPVPIAAWVLKTGEDMDRVHTELMKRGIAIQRTRYVGAGPNGALRAVVFANHRPEQIDRLLGELKSLV
jgi:7-keto-8-aminopelargonate synthetase-like enzyme